MITRTSLVATVIHWQRFSYSTLVVAPMIARSRRLSASTCMYFSYQAIAQHFICRTCAYIVCTISHAIHLGLHLLQFELPLLLPGHARSAHGGFVSIALESIAVGVLVLALAACVLARGREHDVRVEGRAADDGTAMTTTATAAGLIAGDLAHRRRRPRRLLVLWRRVNDERSERVRRLPHLVAL